VDRPIDQATNSLLVPPGFRGDGKGNAMAPRWKGKNSGEVGSAGQGRRGQGRRRHGARWRFGRRVEGGRGSMGTKEEGVC
jgi:hypothetical protein